VTTAWFHCFAGVAGDMVLGALLDAGADEAAVRDVLGSLGVDGWELVVERTSRNGIAARRAVVRTEEQPPHRRVAELVAILDRAPLPPRVRERAGAVFSALARVEGAIHDVPPHEVELHEVGALDALVDVVGACAALEALGVDDVVCSPITTGFGTVRAAHGAIPHPAPAVLALLAEREAPTVGVEVPVELATPTGVALMTTLAGRFGTLPPMAVQRVGYGAGGRTLPELPNLVQVVIGTPTAASGSQPVVLLEANVDDATGEVLAHAVATLLSAGAHDAWITPIVMKKGRPAHTVSVLCDPARAAKLRRVLIAETGTLGVRGTTLERWPQDRRELTVEVGGHAVRVKVSADRVKAEHDDAAAAATALGRPLRDVLAEAEQLARLAR
jgi:uncharacterized protein (TIGR00299 family) protein